MTQKYQKCEKKYFAMSDQFTNNIIDGKIKEKEILVTESAFS